MKKSYIIKIILVVLMLAFIWGNSLMPGTISQEESDAVGNLIARFIAVLQSYFEYFGLNLAADFLVRKLAHFSEFAILGVLVTILLLRDNGRTRPLLSGFLCLCAAAADETIQLLWADRSSRIADVCIDFSGSVCGIAAAALICVLIRTAGKKKKRGGRHLSSR